MRFFPGVIIAITLLFCGTAFADLVFLENGTLSRVDSQGITHSTDITASYVFPFTHNGNPRILTADSQGNIAVYDPANLSSPLSSGTLTTGSGNFEPVAAAELGSNIVINCDGSLFEVAPQTCEVVSSYGAQYSGYDSNCNRRYAAGDEGVSGIYPYGGQLVVMIDRVNSYGSSWEFSRIVTMDTLGHITGTFDDFEVYGALEASGGELYFALGDYAYYRNAEAASLQGIYRVSRMLGNMDYHNAVRVISHNPCQMTRDGKGGLYYSVYGGEEMNYFGSVRYIYHWDGSSSSQVYDIGANGSSAYNGGINDIQYDITNGILYAEINGELTALVPDSSGNLTASHNLGSSVNQWTVAGNPAEGSSGNPAIPQTPAQPQTPTQTTTLPSGVIEPAPELSPDVVANLASLVSTDSSQIRFITQENISSPEDPTQAMKDYMHNDGYDAAYKLNTLTVSNDGYYVFLVNVPDELVGMKVSDVRMYALKHADFSSSFMSLINGILNYGEITNLFGVKIETLEAKVLAIGFLQAGTPFSVYLAKIIIALLAGGCDSGLGIVAICVLSATIFSRKILSFMR